MNNIKTPWDEQTAVTELEKVMVQMAPDMKRHGQRCYMAGVLDTWASLGVITDAVRGSLYTLYCF